MRAARRRGPFGRSKTDAKAASSADIASAPEPGQPRMFELVLGPSPRELRTLLCLGAHCDDIEIGCGGTVLRLPERCPELRVHWVVWSSAPERAAEARRIAERFLRRVRNQEVVIKEFRNSF